jgi:hypothetical protein
MRIKLSVTDQYGAKKLLAAAVSANIERPASACENSQELMARPRRGNFVANQASLRIAGCVKSVGDAGESNLPTLSRMIIWKSRTGDEAVPGGGAECRRSVAPGRKSGLVSQAGS